MDEAGMEERMDAIRLKQLLGEPLSERELMCLQIEQNGFGCTADRWQAEYHLAATGGPPLLLDHRRNGNSGLL